VKSLLCITVLVAGLSTAITARGADKGAPDFARDVLPIFKEHCYECHGPDKQRNGYRLDRRSSAFGGMIRHNISPGSSESSRLYRRLVDSQFGPQMPVEDTLSDEQIATIKRWIDAGAHWPDALANEADVPPPDPRAIALSALIRDQAFGRVSRKKLLQAIRAQPEVVNARGDGGTTPLMEAALYSDATVLDAMLDAGGDAKVTNYRGATALLWAIEDADKTRLLLERGANPNAASDFGQTPLTQAAAKRDSARVVTLLLEHGAEPTPAALIAAAGKGNARALEVLLARLPDKGDAALTAMRVNCKECLRLLDRRGPVKLPRALAIALPVANEGHPATVRAALSRQPDVNLRDAKGRTPLMLAAISENVPADFVRTLVDRGASVDAKSKEGLTALDYALRLGRADFIDALKQAGAVATPATPTPAPAYVTGNDVRAAIARSTALLQRSGITFYEKGGCVSCHHNILGLKTTRMLRERGLPYDREIEGREKRFLADDVRMLREQSLQGIGIGGGLALPVGYITMGLAEAGHPPDASTDAMARLIRRAQLADGRWITAHRPPSESSEFTATAVGLRALQLYGNPRNDADREAIRLAGEWLRRHTPVNTEDHTFRLLGLVWSGAPSATRRAAVNSLLTLQREDGGWGQLPYRASDAYATGQALVALREAGFPTTAPAYARGVRYLLDTQLVDGTWLVRTRSLFTQHYFESGFPHGIDQFISAAATHWSVQALAGTLPVQKKSSPAYQSLLMGPKPATDDRSWVGTPATGTRPTAILRHPATSPQR
jgi:ankyrin repeat protein